MTLTQEPTTEPDATKLSKIRAMLDKAEATSAEFPEEAEALTVKAMEWMERYRIDIAMIADAAPKQDRGKLVERAVSVGSGPYVNARVSLANRIAMNNSVVLLQSTGYRGKTIYLTGYETDVELTEMLYTSLLLQATSAMNSSAVKDTKPDYVHGTAFNRAFLLGFADRIGERLAVANKVAADDTVVADGTRSVALVLADRSKDAEDFVFKRYGKLRSAPSIAPASSGRGLSVGAEAANSADIGTERRFGSYVRGAISA